LGSIFGSQFRFLTWGEAHGPAVGVVIEGCPAGLAFDEAFLKSELARDVPDTDIGTTRREPNKAEILSGVFEGITLGTPICIVIRNEDICSRRYEIIRTCPRPGHADYTYRARYSHVDWRGGSRASGRECICRVVAGAVAKMLLRPCGITVCSRITSLAGLPVATCADYEAAKKRVLEIGGTGDSSGGVIEVTAAGVPAGVGSPIFDKLDARLGLAMMSIGGVAAFEMGSGTAFAAMTGAEANDPFTMDGGAVRTTTNNCGGVQGGISNGMEIRFTITVKPTPSIAVPQQSVNLHTKEPVVLETQGRFDHNFTPRVLAVVEAMTAATLVDLLIEGGFIHPVRFEESRLPTARLSRNPIS
jgi:chorismate synthase